MVFMKNMKIRKKLLTAFSINIFLTAVTAAAGIYAIITAQNTYTHLFDFPNERYNIYADSQFRLMAVQRGFSMLIVNSGDKALLDITYNDVTAQKNIFISNLEEALINIQKDISLDPATVTAYSESIRKLITDIEYYYSAAVEPTYDLALDGNIYGSAIRDKIDYADSIASPIMNGLSGLMEKNYKVLYNTWFPNNTNLESFVSADAAFDALEEDKIDLLLTSESMLLYQLNYRKNWGIWKYP